MRRVLLQSTAFIKAARRWVKKHPDDAAVLQRVLESLAADAFRPELKTHKLKGELAGSWACSAGYDLRIVFEFVQHEGAEASCCKPLAPTMRFINGSAEDDTFSISALCTVKRLGPPECGER